MQLKLTYCECLVWNNHNQHHWVLFFFLADEWAEAGDVLAWPLSSPSPTAMAQQSSDKLKLLSLEWL